MNLVFGHTMLENAIMIAWTVPLVPVIWQTLCQGPFVSHFLTMLDWADIFVYLT